MLDILENAIAHTISIQNIITETVKQRRGGEFDIADWEPILKEKMRFEAAKGQSKQVVDLYKQASIAHHSIISELTEIIEPEDEPWTENLQVAPVLEMLYLSDSKLKDSIQKFVDIMMKSDWEIDTFILGRITGQHGTTWIHNSSAIPASSGNFYRRLFAKIDIPIEHQEIILAVTSIARNTSYSNLLGTIFAKDFYRGISWSQAITREKEYLKNMWLFPMETQHKILSELGFKSFDSIEYMKKFQQRIKVEVHNCIKSGIHPGNVLYLMNTAGGVEHHLGKMTYNMCKDDMVMAIYESVSQVLVQTLLNAQKEDKLKKPEDVPIGIITAAATAKILWMDGFTVDMVNALLSQRARNLYLKNPILYLREDLNSVFLNYLACGEKVIMEKPKGLGGEINGIKIDFSPIYKNEVLQHPARYTWGQTPFTVRFSGLIRFADEPFVLISDPAILTWTVNLIALEPTKMIMDNSCRMCIEASLLPHRCDYCLAKKEPANKMILGF